MSSLFAHPFFSAEPAPALAEVAAAADRHDGVLASMLRIAGDFTPRSTERRTLLWEAYARAQTTLRVLGPNHQPERPRRRPMLRLVEPRAHPTAADWWVR